MIRDLSKYGEIKVLGAEEVYLCHVTPKMIKSIIFGYAYDKNRLASDGAKLLVFNPDLHVSIAIPNYAKHDIEVRQII